MITARMLSCLKAASFTKAALSPCMLYFPALMILVMPVAPVFAIIPLSSDMILKIISSASMF